MTTVIGLLDGAALFVLPGFVLQDEQLLETPRHVAEFAIDQIESAIQVRRRHVIATKSANETIVLSHDVFETPAKLANLRQHFRTCDGRASSSFSF